MKTLMITALCLATAAFAQDQGKKKGGGPPPGPPFTLMVSGYADGAEIPVKYSCSNAPAGESPAISWKNVPMGTQSFVLLLHDPEAHPGRGMYDVTHWLVWNIPGTTTELPEAVKANTNLGGAMQGKGPRGDVGYFGPCAPPTANLHHYTYEIYALDTKLDVPADAGRADVMKAMDGHVLGSAVYVGLFKRTQ